jgi:hypothetical protein
VVFQGTNNEIHAFFCVGRYSGDFLLCPIKHSHVFISFCIDVNFSADGLQRAYSELLRSAEPGAPVASGLWKPHKLNMVYCVWANSTSTIIFSFCQDVKRLESTLLQ